MNRIYQWLSERASFFGHDVVGHGTSRTVRTEVTVERQDTILLATGSALDTCPLCGQKVAPAMAEQVGLRLQGGSANKDYD